MKIATHVKSHRVVFMQEELLLHPERAIFWRSKESLILADLHLGKASHFRRNGIAVPDHLGCSDLIRLEALIQQFKPKNMLILGDLFHSFHNAEWELFGDFRRQYDHINFVLIQGNHDIMSQHQYDKYDLQTLDVMSIGPFLLSHEPVHDSTLYNIHGHIHPGVRMIGSARQSLRLPCFYFGQESGVLPAFGTFTGLALLKPKAKDRIFVISDNEVVEATRSTDTG